MGRARLQRGCTRRYASARPTGLWLTFMAHTSYGASMHGVVTVEGGRVRGVWREDLWSFAGIPYASSQRWRLPQPPLPWEGVREASSFGPIAPQIVAAAGITSPADPDHRAAQSEDCLTLNIWTSQVPESPTTEPGAGRPVMVWIHGGGFTSGSGSVFLYRGGHLVRNGDVVVVTINYRLGALGFLGHHMVGDHDFVGNWGLHDQVAALRWVREHIASFGGDPARVTVFGESAGGFSVAALLGAPSAAGLFHRAIVQSGGAHVHSVEQAERVGDRLARALEVPACTREYLRSVPTADLLAATEVIAARRPDPGLIPVPFLPVVDGAFLPRHPLEAVQRGSSSAVELLIGTNRDELALFGLGRPELTALDEPGVLRWAANAVPDLPSEDVMEVYREARTARSEGVDAHALMVAIGSDAVFRWPSLQLAAAHTAHGAPAYVYLFDWECPAFGGVLGACHALELPFVFGVVHVPTVQLFTGSGPAADALSATMQGAWLSFAHSGDPSQAGLEWPAWDPARRATMMFGPQTGVEGMPRNRELSIWERYRPLFVAAPA
jgi:para-nitrobenzyl esterase